MEKMPLTPKQFDEFERKLDERNDIAAHKAKRLMGRRRRWEEG